MCSNSENGTEHLMAKSEQPTKNYRGTCRKCNKSQAALDLPQCEKCFLKLVHHKFRAALGSTKIVGKEARILIVFDGGPQSSALLHMLKFAFNQDQYKRLYFDPHVLYIDDSVLLNDDQRLPRIQRLKVLIKQFGFAVYCTSIADSKSSLFIYDDYIAQTISNDEVNKFQNKLSSIMSHTSCDDYVRNVRTNIIHNAALQLNCKFAFTSEIESDFANIFLTNISLGRGYSVCEDVGFCDTRRDVQIIRPLRALHYGEVGDYVKFNNIECFMETELDIPSLYEESLQNKTKLFIEELQNNFQSTISTIFRTGDKISGSSNNNEIENKHCRFCFSLIPDEQNETMRSLGYSSFVSENPRDNRLNFVNDLSSSTSDDTLCYGCRNIERDISNRRFTIL